MSWKKPIHNPFAGGGYKSANDKKRAEAKLKRAEQEEIRKMYAHKNSVKMVDDVWYLDKDELKQESYGPDGDCIWNTNGALCIKFDNARRSKFVTNAMWYLSKHTDYYLQILRLVFKRVDYEVRWYSGACGYSGSNEVCDCSDGSNDDQNGIAKRHRYYVAVHRENSLREEEHLEIVNRRRNKKKALMYWLNTYVNIHYRRDMHWRHTIIDELFDSHEYNIASWLLEQDTRMLYSRLRTNKQLDIYKYYTIPRARIIRRAVDSLDERAIAVCVAAGLSISDSPSCMYLPQKNGTLYRRVCERFKRADWRAKQHSTFPRETRCAINAVLVLARVRNDAGVGSLWFSMPNELLCEVFVYIGRL